MAPLRTIKAVSRETGLTAHAIRVWEKRYGAVKPVRADNNRRLYSEADVERLQLLHEATAAGHSIGQIAQASVEELRRLVGRGLRSRPAAARVDKGNDNQAVEALLAAALQAVKRLDDEDLSDCLNEGAVRLGSPAMIHRFVVPLAEQVGELWRKGDLSISHEHFATAALTHFLAEFARPYPARDNTPLLLLATPSGQLHELGVVIVAAAARTHGWRTMYLGASLPVEEIAKTARELQPRAVALSIVFPPDDPLLQRDLLRLPALLPENCPVIVGGAAAAGYLPVLRKIKSIYAEKLDDLYPVLERLQRAREKTDRK